MKRALSVMVIIILILCMGCITKYTYASSEGNNITPSVCYNSHLENIGWEQDFSNSDGQTSGRIDQTLKMEAIKIKLKNAPSNASISYQVHVENEGWMKYVSNGSVAGTMGRNLKIEAIRIKLNGLEDYDVMYRAYIEGQGWQDWVKNGELAGTSGQNRRLFAFQIKILPKPFSVKYYSYIAGSGWENAYSKQDGQNSGTTGKNLKLEALRIKLDGAPEGASITYQSHVQDIGWQSWVKEGETTGVAGKSLKVEAMRIKLTGVTGYSIQYRTHVQDIGWQDWVSDGELAGTTGKNLKIEAIQIRIVREDTPYVAYSSHVQDQGWEKDFSKIDGTVSGTTGKNLKVEAMKIKLINAPANAKIKYQSYVQKNGWQSWKENGTLTGTTGKNLKLEAIRIKLEGMENYTIRYRAHVQDIGWQKWVEEGQTAGTIGKGLKVEAIQIELVPLIPADKTNPVITLRGNEVETVRLGSLYKDAGAIAEDNKDGNLTSKIQISNNVNTSKIGTYKVTYKVEDMAGNYATKTRTVKVVDYITGIQITSPTKTTYNYGESLNLSGMTVKAVMKSGTKTNVSIDKCTVTGYDKTKLGDQTIIVTYSGKTATFKVNVKDYITAIELTKPTKTTYKYGESLNLAGMTVKAVMKSGAKPNVAIDKCAVTGYNKTTLGDQTITVTYSGKTATFKVTVTNNITGIKITKLPKTTYKYNQELDITAMEVKATLQSGSEIDVPTKNCAITGYNKTTLGDQTITVTYSEKTATFKVNVSNYVKGIKIETNPTKTEYFVGENIDKTGMVVKAVMANNTREPIELTNINLSTNPSTNIELGTTKVNVNYTTTNTIDGTSKTFTDEFKIDVKKEFSSLVVVREKYMGYAHEEFTYGTISSGPDEEEIDINNLKYQVYKVERTEKGDIVEKEDITDKNLVNVIFAKEAASEGQIYMNVTAEEVGEYTIIPYVGSNIDAEDVIKAAEQSIIIETSPIIATVELVDFSTTEEIEVNEYIIKEIVFKNKHQEIIEEVENKQVEFIAEGVTITALESNDNPGSIVEKIKITGKTEGTSLIQVKVNVGDENVEKTIDLGSIKVLPEPTIELDVSGNTTITLLKDASAERPNNINFAEIPGEEGLVYTLIPVQLKSQKGETTETTKLEGDDLNSFGKDATAEKPFSVTYKDFDSKEQLINIAVFNAEKVKVISEEDDVEYIGVALSSTMYTEEELSVLNQKVLNLNYFGIEKTVELTINII